MPPLICEAPESVGILLDSAFESGGDDGVMERDGVAAALAVPLAAGDGGLCAALFAVCALAGFAFLGSLATFLA